MDQEHYRDRKAYICTGQPKTIGLQVCEEGIADDHKEMGQEDRRQVERHGLSDSPDDYPALSLR